MTGPSSRNTKILRYAIGIIFLLGGILPYLLPKNDPIYTQKFVDFCLASYIPPSTAHVVTYFLIRFATAFSSVVFFPASMLAVYSGFLILKHEHPPKAPLIACGIMQALSIVYGITINTLIYRHTDFVLASVGAPSGEFLSVANILLSTFPDLLQPYQSEWICRGVIAVPLIALVVLLLLQQKRVNGPANIKVPVTGIITMLFALPLIYSSQYMTYLANGSFSNEILNAQNTAANVLSENYDIVFLMGIALMLGTSVFVHRPRSALAVTIVWLAVFFIMGLLSIFSAETLLLKHTRTFHKETPAILKQYLLGGTLLMASLPLWFYAVAQDRIPVVLQALVPLALLLIYLTTDIFGIICFKPSADKIFGLINTSAAIILASILPGIKAKQHT